MAKDPTGIIGAGYVANTPKDKGSRSKDPADILATARSRLTMALAAYSDSREDELDDLRFMAGSPDNAWQWPQDVLAQRGSELSVTLSIFQMRMWRMTPHATTKSRMAKGISAF
jgi:hypothetical protein